MSDFCLALLMNEPETTRGKQFVANSANALNYSKSIWSDFSGVDFCCRLFMLGY